ncbi:hypothetical protein [Brachybacterium sp. GPGPB12]|uniref:hypothetical protein n=1 Tax=Brachybacterium sp. GPGPB12 TaxID=3023517 RepID=UPI003134247C
MSDSDRPMPDQDLPEGTSDPSPGAGGAKTGPRGGDGPRGPGADHRGREGGPCARALRGLGHHRPRGPRGGPQASRHVHRLHR